MRCKAQESSKKRVMFAGKYTVVPYDEAKRVMMARDLRQLIDATSGYSSRFVWAVLSEARGRETKPRLAAALLHDEGYRNASIMSITSGKRDARMDVAALLRLFRGSAAVFPRDPDASIDLLGVSIYSTLTTRFEPTASMPAPYVTPDGKGIMVVRLQPRPPDENTQRTTIVTALLKARGERWKAGCSPGDAQAMRTVMTTTKRSDGTLVVGFWPPVGVWKKCEDDMELHVWLRLAGGREHVDMMRAETPSAPGRATKAQAQTQAYPRLCKMMCHSPGGPLIASKRYMDEPSNRFLALAEVSVLPEWPEKLYLDERACLQRLGDAHVMDRRDRAARKIQAAWGDAVSMPEMRMCRRRLLREFAEMTE